MGAVVEAVEAKDALAYSYISGGFAAAFAGLFTYHAIGAFLLPFSDSPDCEAAEQAEQCAERADESAIEAGDNQIKQYSGEKDCRYQPCAFVEAVGYRGHISGSVNDGDNHKVEGTGYKRYRVEQACLEGGGNRRKGGHAEEQNEYEVFYALGLSVFIDSDFFGGGFFAVGKKSGKVVQRAEGADPTAEESAEYYCQNYHRQGPKQGVVKCMGGQDGADCDEGVEMEKEVNGPASDLRELVAHGAGDAEPDKKREKEDLTYASCLYNLHNSTFNLSEQIVV
jgi:hypothetical protein